jgi:hypothetical protein
MLNVAVALTVGLFLHVAQLAGGPVGGEADHVQILQAHLLQQLAVSGAHALGGGHLGGHLGQPRLAVQHLQSANTQRTRPLAKFRFTPILTRCDRPSIIFQT